MMSALGDGIVVQGELGHVVLAGHHILDQFVFFVLEVGREEHELTGVGYLAKGRDQGGLVAVADVVLGSVGQPGAVVLGGQGHFGGVDVGAMITLGQSEGKDRTVAQQFGGPLLHLFILRHPDRAQTQDRNLPGVPVGQAVETEDFVEAGYPVSVPSLGAVAVAGRGEQGRKNLLLFHEFQEIGVPDPLLVVFLDAGLPLFLKKPDGLEHDLARRLIQVSRVELVRIEQEHEYSFTWSRG